MALLVRFAWPAHLADEAPGVSAMSGVTDSLINLARQVSQNPSEREMDVIFSTGEERLDLAGQAGAGVQFRGVTDLRRAGDGLHEILGLEGGMGPAHASHHPSGEPIAARLEVNSLRSVVLHAKRLQNNGNKRKSRIAAMKASIGKPRRFRTASDRYRNRGLRPLFQKEKVAESTGLEPATSAVTGRRSNQLS